MSRPSTKPTSETFTFRLEPALKEALRRSANDERMAPGELMRLLLRQHLTGRARRAFESEARRQSTTIAARASVAESGDAEVMREIEASLDRDDFAPEWKA